MVDRGYTTFGYMQMQMVVAHGGRCAERIVFGDDITDGGTDDLEKITKVNILSNFTIKVLLCVSEKLKRRTKTFIIVYKILHGHSRHLFQIAREMVISPRNPRLGLTALTKRIGLVDRPDNPDGEIIRYKVSFTSLW